MSGRAVVEDLRVPGSRDEARVLQQRWHGWGSPIALGVGLLCVGGFFVLLTLGLSILDSIG
jgi:hypothetical protein